ncbi:MAG: hypothetical protein LBK02_08365 [Treponema sp.]|nr:hypothetical protein [Treponema sp.]
MILTVLACRNPTSPQSSKPAQTGTVKEISLAIVDKGGTLEVAGTAENLIIYKKPGKPGNADSLRLTVSNSDYTCTWYVDGDLPGINGPDITIKAAEYALGGHTVLLKAKDNTSGVPWSKNILFSVKPGSQED